MAKKILIVVLAAFILSGCAQKGSIKQSRALLGTIVEIIVADPDKPPQLVRQAINKAFAEIKRIEKLFSKFDPNSDVSRINRYGSIQPTKVSAETIALLQQSIEYSRKSQGAFDITINPLTEVWNLGKKQPAKIPAPEEIKKALEKVGYEKIAILAREQTVFLKRPGMSIDLGGIAAGYAVDRAIVILKQDKIQNALINAGGDIYCLGRLSPQKKWRVGLKHPRKKNTFLTVLELENQAVTTSGDYERFMIINGRRFSHILNPETGLPCAEAPASVTVIAPSCLAADALATAIFVLGPEQGIDLANQLKQTEAIVASVKDEKLDIIFSSGLQGQVNSNL